MARVTARDAQIMETLGSFGMLASRQIGELLFQGVRKTTLCRRLRTLEKGGLIRRIRGLPDATAMWALTPESAQSIGVDAKISRVNRNSLEHDLLLADVRIALSRAGLVENWIPEHELRHRAWRERFERRMEVELIPDALITVNVRGTFRVIALEVEQRLKSRRRYKKIFRNYLGMSSVWAVWYIVPRAEMGEKLEGLWLQEPHYLRTAKFLWSTVPEVLENLPQAKVHEDGTQYPLTDMLTA